MEYNILDNVKRHEMFPNAMKRFFGEEWNQTEVDPHVCDRLQHAVNPIDVGCGFNPYKEFHDNLIGVDIVNKKADFNCDILNFSPGDRKFDVAICYGVLHFNSYHWIRERLEWVVKNTTDDGQIPDQITLHINSLRKDNDELSTKAAALETIISNKNAEILDLQVQLAQSSGQIDDLSDEVTELNIQLSIPIICISSTPKIQDAIIAGFII